VLIGRKAQRRAELARRLHGGGLPARTRLSKPPEAHLAGRGRNTATTAVAGSSRRDSGARSLERRLQVVIDDVE